MERTEKGGRQPDLGGLRPGSRSENWWVPSVPVALPGIFHSCLTPPPHHLVRWAQLPSPWVRKTACLRSHSGRDRAGRKPRSAWCPGPGWSFPLSSFPTVLGRPPGPPASPEPVRHVPVLLHLHTHNLCHQGDDLLSLLQALPVLHCGHFALFD